MRAAPSDAGHADPSDVDLRAGQQGVEGDPVVAESHPPGRRPAGRGVVLGPGHNRAGFEPEHREPPPRHRERGRLTIRAGPERLHPLRGVADEHDRRDAEVGVRVGGEDPDRPDRRSRPIVHLDVLDTNPFEHLPPQGIHDRGLGPGREVAQEVLDGPADRRACLFPGRTVLGDRQRFDAQAFGATGSGREPKSTQDGHPTEPACAASHGFSLRRSEVLAFKGSTGMLTLTAVRPACNLPIGAARALPGPGFRPVCW